MTMHSRTVAQGAGWRVHSLVCTAGPHDRPFEEQHNTVCIAAVAGGSFHYRSAQGDALLVPGAVLLGNHGSCFECSHEHSTGDHCLAFHFTPEHWEAVTAAVPGARTATFNAPRLPPLPELAALIATAESACELGDAAELEELSVRMAGAVATVQADAGVLNWRPSRRDEKRIADAVRLIEANAGEPSDVTLSALAAAVAMSPYHFLRTFRHVAGMTPHQFVLRTRLHRAAVRIRQTNDPITAIALDAGFQDLSTFNHRFRRVMGVSPTRYRARRA